MTADAGHLEKAGGAEDSFETYLYLITHDLRACFRALKTIPVWIAEDLNNAEVPAEVYAHLEMLTTQALRGDRMLIDLREFSRVGRLSSPPVTEDIRSIAERCWQALSPPDTVELDLDQAEGAVTLPHEDATRLFSALLENAVKHRDRPEGHVRIVSSSEPDARIRIEDDGPGIAEEYREKAFELLTTLRPRDACEGSGVGLALARKIVEAAGGVIGLEHVRAGRGLCVSIHLPQGEDLVN
jgi:signal transduction histidine kinase